MGLAQIMRGNWEFLEEQRNWHVEIIIIDFTVFTEKKDETSLVLTVNLGRKGIRIPGVKISTNPSKL